MIAFLFLCYLITLALSMREKHSFSTAGFMEKGAMRVFFGAHLSISKGYKKAVKEALAIGANTFQFFTRNPRGIKAKALDYEDIAKANQLREEMGFGPLVAHAPYTLNLASPKDELWELAIQVLTDDLKRLEYLQPVYLNFHPGSHTGSGVEAGIKRIAEGLKRVLSEGPFQTMLLLEGMSGSGSEIGYTFEQLAWIKDLTGCEKIGFCLDTCHLYGAGYDVKEHLTEVLAEADQVLGLEWVKAFHLNDSVQPLGSRKDRHANLGEGQIGKEAIRDLAYHPALAGKVFLLETPGGLDNYRLEIAFLRQTGENNHIYLSK